MDNMQMLFAGILENVLKLGSVIVAYWSCDDKKKIKVDPLGEPYALETRTLIRWVPRNRQIESLDHDMGIKVSLTPSILLNIIQPRDNKLGSF